MSDDNTAPLPEGFQASPGFDDDVDAKLIGEAGEQAADIMPAQTDDAQTDDTQTDDTQTDDTQTDDTQTDDTQTDDELASGTLEDGSQTVEDQQAGEDQQQQAGEEEQLFDIVHNGVAQRVTKEKLIDLAQKGYDYDTKVGNHARLAQLVESDPGLRDVINGYFTERVDNLPAEQKAKIDIKPLDDYDNETEWLQDNIQSVIANQAPAQTTPPDAGMDIQQMLMIKDPVNYKTVAPEVLRRAQTELTMAQYQEINTDPAKFFEFYDKVSGDMQGDTTSPPSQQPSAPLKPTFTSKPGNNSSSNRGKKVDAFAMSKAEFKKTMDALTMGNFNN